MAIPSPGYVVPEVPGRHLAFGSDTPTDAELIARFTRNRDEAAFEALVRLHGPMVLRLCRRVVRDEHAAEDAFQATFLTLACKAGAIRRQESVGSWLYRVAYRVALRAADQATRQQTWQRPLADSASRADPAELAAWRELGALLHAEVGRLPEKYRAPVILCYLQGRTNEEAARTLRCPKGTILSRLARARDRLRKRLDPMGVLLSGAPFPLLAARDFFATGAEPSALFAETARAATSIIREPASASIAPSVLRLMSTARVAWHVLKVGSIALLILLILLATLARVFSVAAGPSWKAWVSEPSTGGCHGSP